MLETPVIIAVVLLLGGIVLLFVDKWFMNPSITNDEEITNEKALKIGFYQTLAVIFPGLSRSASTIIGGMQQGLTRSLAAEFSFFLAVPTMAAATLKSIYDVYKETPEVLSTDNLGILVVGNIVAILLLVMHFGFNIL